MSISYAVEVVFKGTQYRAVLNYYRDPHQRKQKDWERVGGLVARADRRGAAQKGQGTASEGHKSWWKCLPQEAIVSTLNSTPSLHVSAPPLNSFESFEASECHRGPRGRWKRKERLQFWLDVLFDRTLQCNKRQWKGNMGEGGGESQDGDTKRYVFRGESSMCNTPVVKSGGVTYIHRQGWLRDTGTCKVKVKALKISSESFRMQF